MGDDYGNISESARQALRNREVSYKAEPWNMRLARAAEHVPSSSTLTFCGGVISVVAFLLPWFSSFFFSTISNDSLLTILTQPGTQYNGIPGLWLGWIEPLAAVTLLIVPWCFGILGRMAHTLDLLASVVGLAWLLYLLVALSTHNPASPFLYLSVGFWLAIPGFMLSLGGAIEGRRGQDYSTLFTDDFDVYFVLGFFTMLICFFPWIGVFSIFGLSSGPSGLINIPSLWLGWVEPLAAATLLIIPWCFGILGRRTLSLALLASIVGLVWPLYLPVAIGIGSQINPFLFLSDGFYLAVIFFAASLFLTLKAQRRERRAEEAK